MVPHEAPCPHNVQPRETPPPPRTMAAVPILSARVQIISPHFNSTSMSPAGINFFHITSVSLYAVNVHRKIMVILSRLCKRSSSSTIYHALALQKNSCMPHRRFYFSTKGPVIYITDCVTAELSEHMGGGVCHNWLLCYEISKRIWLIVRLTNICWLGRVGAKTKQVQRQSSTPRPMSYGTLFNGADATKDPYPGRTLTQMLTIA